MACLHGETVTAVDKNMLNFLEGNLIRKDNTEKNITDPDAPPRAFQLSIDVAGLDQWRPPKKTNTSHDGSADESEDGKVPAGALAASWKLDRVVEGKELIQVAPAPTERGIDRKAHKQAEQASLSDTTARTSKVERVRVAKDMQVVKAQLDALWERGTAHLSKSA
jgi:hypothetical protein